MKSISTINMSRKEWLKHRREGIGSSDGAAIIGLNPYRSAHDVWEDKLGLSETETSERMRAGVIEEEYIADRWAKESGRKILRDHKIRIHQDHDWLRANLDRVISDKERGPGSLEIKNTTQQAINKWDWEPGFSVPSIYFPQCQHQLLVTGWNWGVFVVRVDGWKLIETPFTRNNEFLEAYFQELKRFWFDHVKKEIPPPWSPLDVPKIPVSEGTEKETNTIGLEKVMELKRVREELDRLKKKADLLQTQVQLEMGMNEFLTYHKDPIASWKGYTSNRIDTTRLKKELPEVAERFTKIIETRRFKII